MQPSPPEKQQEDGSSLRRLLRFWLSPETLLNATGLLSLLAVGAGAAMLLPPARLSGDLPQADDLGRLAVTSVKANRDYIIPDPEATRALREDAARVVRPLYDFDATLGEQASERIERAFAYMRAQMPPEGQAAPERRGRSRRASPGGADPIALAQPHYAEFLKRLQAVVEEPQFRELARTRFAPEVERAAVLLVRGVMDGEVAPSRELLYAERDNGITLRTLGAGQAARPERETRDVERIPDLAAVRHALGRLAQGLPEAPGSMTGLGRVALALPAELTPEGRKAAALLAARVVTPNLSYNENETRARQTAAARAVKPVVLQYARGEKIIGDGERIEQRHLLAFRYITEQARALDTFQVRLGAALFAMLLAFSVFRLARRTVRRFRPSKRDLVFLTSVLLANLALVRAVIWACEQLRDEVPLLTNDVAVLLVPLTAGTILVRLLRSGEASVVFALVFAPLVALQVDAFEPAAVGLLASVIAVDRLGRSGVRRAALVWAGLQAGLFAGLAVATLSLFGGHAPLAETGIRIASAVVGNGLLSPLAAALVAPLFEAVFGYTTQHRLHRLVNLNHPVLKELIIRAPGTYHHSLLVGDLACAAARRIDANELLARVGGYFHDLGKAESPLMFSENQRGENRLERLEPVEAAKVLRRHVKAGVELATKARLPRAVVDIIAQHHGKAHAGTFFEKALDQHRAEGSDPVVDEEAFCYEGPKPRTREAALVMLADVVEAASRALPDATPDRLRALVSKVVEPMLLSGQFDECDLTIAELHRVIEALQDALVEVHGLTRVDVLPGLRAVTNPTLPVNPSSPPQKAARH